MMNNAKRFPSHSLSFLGIANAFLLILSGCDNGPRIVPAGGIVVFEDGSPVRVGTVETKWLGSGEPIQATGKIENDGSFVLSTRGDGDGAAVGDHQCVVVQLVLSEEIKGHQPTTQGIVNTKYNNYNTSGLRISIPPEGDKKLKLVVTGVAKLPGEKPHKHE